MRALLDVVPYLGKRCRICRCGNPACRKWLLTNSKKGHHFCGDSCKQRYHYHCVPGKREKKKAYMRKLRDDAKKRARLLKRWPPKGGSAGSGPRPGSPRANPSPRCAGRFSGTPGSYPLFSMWH